MNILSINQIRKADQFTVENEPVSSIELMERACRAFIDAFQQYFPHKNQVLVFCGPGNNGGDGLGIARMLHQKGYPIKVIIFHAKKYSDDYLVNLKSLPKDIPLQEWHEFSFSSIPQTIIVDAIFGSGLDRPLGNSYLEAVRAINSSKATVVSVDIPSGMNADSPLQSDSIRCDLCITFQYPKLSFFTEAGENLTHFEVVDIGLKKEFLNTITCSDYLVETEQIRKILPVRKRHTHKGDYGHVLLIGGSVGMMGAMILAARAALRAGIGKVTCYIPGCGRDVLQIAVPEAMVICDPNPYYLTTIPQLEKYDAVGIGPGMGRNEKSKDILNQLSNFTGKLVIDADALHWLATQPQLIEKLPKTTVLTPHEGEWKKISKINGPRSLLIEQIKDYATQNRVTVVLKGPYSVVASSKGERFFSMTGNPGMATAGSGDVLTGVISSLAAQGLSPVEAALSGVYLHGLAGDISAEITGMNALIASDISNGLSAAFKKVLNSAIE